MSPRIFALLGAAAIAFTSAAQTVPLAADGHPDLQGNWLNQSATPLERPKQLEGRQSLTDAEVAELRTRANRIFRDGKSDFPSPVRDDYFLTALANQAEVYKSATATGGADLFPGLEFDNRTSLIVDPPDGKLPPYTPEGLRRQRANAAAGVVANHPAGPENLTNMQRCITWGVPMLQSGPYTNHYQIV